ncbi:hypothetical protein LI171_04920 [Emergencia timonensis]|uniref:hypothetical protein n=1 Tax=Emergencia timonensis TaxID=1776384 RepID=UPI001D086C4E|nr:hypothetical protein [Emergencia timonensis]MCB6475580.1 hypothetical protein [Emergencia timonensis]
MNDKEKLLRDWGRMCKKSGRCSNCPMDRMKEKEGSCDLCQLWAARHPEQAVKAIEKWGAEHPAKTMQDVFLEQYPEVSLDGCGIISIMPCVMENISCRTDDGGDMLRDCQGCRHNYWSQEVADE